MQEQKICPYPGLRPFNEDESIFFRGREEHIEKIISQLEEKKFVMLTGASGDGKSSIVYAGVIPNARAGFFKAKFNSWQIADFRPERSPLKNMAIALADKLGYLDVDFVEKQLGFGFSSLINLYKNSKYFLDQNSEAWKKADETEKKKLKRKAANLFILVDQFEEFFTNSENYHNGRASVESQTVINSLLETARIALAEDLPIYIICTMRSDYIGQCAAFRGLPEYIGFSQFFVPRLKRKEIHQVIEEPATLSGNTISNRLTETLINELGDGFDQLPVLQHALNQVWNQADRGNEEMDLIHLTKLSGLPEKNLPVEDVQNFFKWFNTVPDFKKVFFKNPSLENVLNAHANELYQTASDYYNSNQENKITKEDACLIIKAAFQCLTKIDDSRAVRNRMTLDEICKIINREEITTEIVGGVLDVFRLQGNTFLKPFITSDELSKQLHRDDVLDITHESLIRNWDLLEEWAKEEYDNWLNFQDFNKQLQRWISNDKGKGYLLPIGPLTFFENWYNTCKPNKNWLARYDASDLSKEEKLEKAEKILKSANEFLGLSSRRLFFSKTILKYGANKVIAYLGIIILIISCTYFYIGFLQKQNSYIVEDLEQRGLDLLSSGKVGIDYKANFLINYERLEPGSFDEVLCDLDNDTMAFDIGVEMFGRVQNVDKYKTSSNDINPIVYPLLSFMDGRLNNLTNRQRVIFNKTHTYNLNRINKFLSICAFVKSYDDNDTINKLIDRNSLILNTQLVDVLTQPVDDSKVDVTQFDNSLQLLLAIAPKTDFKYFIQKLSPWEMEDEAKQRFEEFYGHDITYSRGDGQDKKYNSTGYQILACLYATDTVSNEDNTNKISSCIDMAMSNDPEYKKNDFSSFFDIICTLNRYNNYSENNISTLLNAYSKSSATGILDIMNKTIANTFIVHIPYEKITERFTQLNYFSKYFCSFGQRADVWNNYLTMLIDIKQSGKVNSYWLVSTESQHNIINRTETEFSEDEFNFNLALYYKKYGTYYAEIVKYKRQTNQNIKLANENFKRAFEYYDLLSDEFKNTFCEVGTFNHLIGESKILKKSFVFLYPKVINEYIKRTFYTTSVNTETNYYGFMAEQSQSTAFFNYIKNNNLTKYYESEDGLKMLENFSYAIFENNFKKDSLFYTIADFIRHKDSTCSTPMECMHFEFFSLALINRDFENNDTAKAFKKYSKYYKLNTIKKFVKNGFLNDTYDAFNTAGNHEMLLRSIAKHLAINNHLEESFEIINALKGPVKRNLLIEIAYTLQEKGPVENSFIYLDSLFKNNDIDGKPKFGMNLLTILGMVGSQDAFDLSMKLIKDMPELFKPKAMSNFIKGVAYNSTNGYYYKAVGYIPPTVSTNKELQLYNEILQTEIAKRSKKVKSTEWFDYDESKGDENGDYESRFGEDIKFDNLD